MNSALLLKSFGGLFDRAPAGYAPGATLGRMLAQARGSLAVVAMQPPAGALLATPDGSLQFEVRERVERHFLMHIVALEFTLKVPTNSLPGARIGVGNAGFWTSSGVSFRVPSGQREALKPVTERLAGDRELVGALLGFDFRRCQLTGTAEGWTVGIEPFAASEVVNRMPSFRRYIRLVREQADALVAALQAFERILSLPAE